ncbi:hypothetical protein HK101_001599 [Irineochytrium annulatum]|nr:hypothetical protein HK101_001599 [Irineochytrium annulatum]
MEGDPDFYDVLGLTVTSTIQEINKAYRKKALTCHPDKVAKGDTKSADLFLLLTRAVETLTDAAKRRAYDEHHRARVAQKARAATLDASRKRGRDALEERERAAQVRRGQERADEEAKKNELERLRAEGLRRMKELERMMDAEMAGTSAAAGVGVGSEPRLGAEKVAPRAPAEDEDVHGLSVLVKWNRKKQTFTQDEVVAILGAYGELDAMTMKTFTLVTFRRGESVRAVMEAKDRVEALRCFTIEPAEQMLAGKKSGGGGGNAAGKAKTEEKEVKPLSGFSYTAPTVHASDPGYEAHILEKMRRKKRKGGMVEAS